MFNCNSRKSIDVISASFYTRHWCKSVRGETTAKIQLFAEEQMFSCILIRIWKIRGTRKQDNLLEMYGFCKLYITTYRKSWTLDAWSGRLDSGRLDSGSIDSWTLDAWTLDAWILDDWTLNEWMLGFWTFELWTIEPLDSAQVFFRIFTTTAEHLDFAEHSQLLQIFTGLYCLQWLLCAEHFYIISFIFYKIKKLVT